MPKNDHRKLKNKLYTPVASTSFHKFFKFLDSIYLNLSIAVCIFCKISSIFSQAVSMTSLS